MLSSSTQRQVKLEIYRIRAVYVEEIVIFKKFGALRARNIHRFRIHLWRRLASIRGYFGEQKSKL